MSVGHRNVFNGTVRDTDAWLTTEELEVDFTPCCVGYKSDSVGASMHCGGGAGESIVPDEQEENDSCWTGDDEDDSPDKKDENEPNEGGSRDESLAVPYGTFSEAS
ncbi:hypothetical protein TRVL_08407 [Trypanosoma vivax]|nr:hypothetical protein TRVL_08407 [Trypanosoma vivax]